MKYNFYPPTIGTNTSFQDNYAMYGSDTASYPIYLELVPNDLIELVEETYNQAEREMVLKYQVNADMVSGKEIPLNFSFSIHDEN